MRILHLCNVSGNLGDYIRIRKIHEYLQSSGNEVDFFNLPTKRYPRKRLLLRPDMLKTIVTRKMRLENTEIVREELRLRLGVEAVAPKIATFRPDLILCETIFPALVALNVVEEGVPVITDVHSILSAEYEGDTFGEVIKERVHYLRDVEGMVLRRSARVIAVSDPMRTYIAEKYNVKSAMICVIPNGSDIRQETSRYSEPLKVIFGGIFSYWENVDSYLDLAKRNQTCAFYLLGEGAMKEHILRRIADERIQVRYLGYVSYPESIRRFSKMNVGVAPSVMTANTVVQYPVKVFDYLSCGLPVITPGFGEWAKVISRNKCGFVTKTSSAEEFDESLRSMNKSTWQEMSTNGLRLIRDEFNWPLLLSKLDQILESFK